MRISDWSSDVCSSDLVQDLVLNACGDRNGYRGFVDGFGQALSANIQGNLDRGAFLLQENLGRVGHFQRQIFDVSALQAEARVLAGLRSEEHTSELQSLMRISYAVFCLKKKIH